MSVQIQIDFTDFKAEIARLGPIRLKEIIEQTGGMGITHDLNIVFSERVPAVEAGAPDRIMFRVACDSLAKFKAAA